MLFILYSRIPFLLNIVGGPIFSYAAIVMNIVVFISLFDKHVKTPSTVVMQGLAIADSLTALCTYGFEPMFYNLYMELDMTKFPGYETFKLPFVVLEYPYCLVHYCLSQLGDNFHFVSILLTTSLGLQKLLAVACPIWSKINITKKKSLIVCVLCYIISCILHIPKMAVVTLTTGKGDVCLISPTSDTLEKYVLSFLPIIYSVILICCAVAMVISAVYIIVTLCKRKNIRGHISSSSYEKKSSILVSCIVIVFLVSESPRLFMNIALFDTYRPEEEIKNAVLQKAIGRTHEHFSICISSARLKEQNNTETIHDKTSSGNQCNSKIKEARELVKGIDKAWKHHALSKSLYLELYMIDHFRHYYVMFIEKMVRLIESIDNIDLCFPYTDSQGAKFNSIVKKCLTSAGQIWVKHSDFIMLAASPYSEPMNYIINIATERNINLELLKLFLEIIKLSTIIGCVSNFIIYITMSEKLRHAVLKRLKLKFWKFGHT